MTHFLYCPFTGLGLHNGYRGDEWLKNRIRVFSRFVLPSLVNQKDRDFILWVSWRLEEENNPIVVEFFSMLSNIRDLNVIFTFKGLCFYDDKYETDEAEDRLFTSLSETLPELENIVGDSKTVLMTIQPSDDMYVSDAVKDIKAKFREHPHITATGYVHGLIMNYATKEVAEYNPDTLPPFATIKFTREQFLDPNEHFDHIGPYTSHEYVKDHLSFLPMRGRGFVVGTHGENVSTVFNHPYRGRILSKESTDNVLMKTGTYFAEPLVLKKGKRLFARQVLNVLPGNEIIRRAYHKLPSCFKLF